MNQAYKVGQKVKVYHSNETGIIQGVLLGETEEDNYLYLVRVNGKTERYTWMSLDLVE